MDRKMDTMRKVGEAIEKGYEVEIVNFIDKLNKKETLPDELEKRLEQIGNNPIDEKDLYDKLNGFGNEADKIDLVDELLETPDVFSALELARFIYEVEHKIVSLRDKGGSFKSTSNTQDAKLLNRKQYKEIMKILSTGNVVTATPDQLAKAYPKGLEYSGLDQDNLSEWEKMLVSTMMVMSAMDVWAHSTGKR